MEEARGVSNLEVQNHFLELLKEINEYNFKHVKVDFFLHGVLSLELIERMNADNNNIKIFFDDVDSFYEKIYSIITNRSIHMGPLTLMYMNAGYMSYENGIEFYKATTLMQRYLQSNYKKYKHYEEFFGGFSIPANALGGMIFKFPYEIRYSGYKDLDSYINAFYQQDKKIDATKRTNFCGSMLSNLKIMYDGTISHCQNIMFDAYETNRNKNKKMNSKDDLHTQAIKSYQEHKNVFINLLTSSDEEINKAIYQAEQATIRNNFRNSVNTIANMMFVMAKVGQIDHSYLVDLNKLKRHAFLMARIEACYYNLVSYTGSIFVHTASQIRFLCNGMMDEAETFINEMLRREGDIPDGFIR